MQYEVYDTAASDENLRLCMCVCLAVCVGVLLVVSVGVALGVFVGGVLLVAAARYFKRLKTYYTNF